MHKSILDYVEGFQGLSLLANMRLKQDLDDLIKDIIGDLSLFRMRVDKTKFSVTDELAAGVLSYDVEVHTGEMYRGRGGGDDGEGAWVLNQVQRY
jgi:hypothetical protein